MKPIVIALLLALCLSSTPRPAAAPCIKGLEASGPSPELAAKLKLFGQFVGDWEFESVGTRPDGSPRRVGKGEWHFGWILEGRAIQDVWIAYAPGAKAGSPSVGQGTAIRFYDPGADAWQVVWINAARARKQFFVAQEIGTEIVLEEQFPKEWPERRRWVLSDITPRSFRWRSVVSRDEGKTWTTEQELLVRRSGQGER